VLAISNCMNSLLRLIKRNKIFTRKKNILNLNLFFLARFNNDNNLWLFLIFSKNKNFEVV